MAHKSTTAERRRGRRGLPRPRRRHVRDIVARVIEREQSGSKPRGGHAMEPSPPCRSYVAAPSGHPSSRRRGRGASRSCALTRRHRPSAACCSSTTRPCGGPCRGDRREPPPRIRSREETPTPADRRDHRPRGAEVLTLHSTEALTSPARCSRATLGRPAPRAWPACPTLPTVTEQLPDGPAGVRRPQPVREGPPLAWMRATIDAPATFASMRSSATRTAPQPRDAGGGVRRALRGPDDDRTRVMVVFSYASVADLGSL